MAFAAQPFSGIATFGRQPHSRDLTGVDVAVLGVPFDATTSYRSGTRMGPRAIREQSLLLWGYNNVLSVAPFETLRIVDYGDAEVVPVDVLATHRSIEHDASTILNAGCRLITLGGDHSISLPLLRAHAKKHGPLAVVHFDAHPDTWDEEFHVPIVSGSHSPSARYSHGTPFRRAIEEGLIDTAAYLQIGIRGPTGGPQDYEDARRLGARLMTIDEALQLGPAAILAEIHARVQQRPVYVTLDIDAIDPAFAPGTGTPEPGGFTSHQMLQLIRGLRDLNLTGFDLVEVAPSFDPSQITSILAANLAFEFLSLLALQKQSLRESS